MNAITSSVKQFGQHTNVISTSHENLQISNTSFAERVFSVIKRHIVFPWIAMLQEDGVTVLLLSRDSETSVQRRVFLCFNGAVQVSVHRKRITGSLLESILQCDGLRNTQRELQPDLESFVDRALSIIKRLKSYEVCVGVDDVQYKPLWGMDRLGGVDNNPYGETRYESTFRPFLYDLIVPTAEYLKRRCAVCIKTKIRFRVKMQRHLNCIPSPSTPNVHLDRNQLLTKVRKQRRSLKDNRHQLVKLKAELKHALSFNNIKNDESVSEDVMRLLMDYISVGNS